MSRNMRHKPQATPTKKPKTTARRNSTLTETTDDDDYAGVDAISDGEDGDEPDVEEAEELAIIESEDDVQTPRPSMDDDQSSWDGFDTQEEILGENTQFFEDHFARGHAPDHDTEATVWNHGLSEDDIGATRRVHFDIPGYDAADESSDTDDDEDVWPDLFVPQSSLDANFRKAIESNEDDVFGGSSDGEGSYWDFHEEHPSHGVASSPKSEDDGTSSSDSSAGSSGYETDDGETTEEDLPAAAKYVGPGRSVLRRPSTDSGSEEEITIARRDSFRNQAGPFLGSWVRDRTKPFVLMDNKAKKLIIFKAEINPRRWSLDAETPRQNLGNFEIQQGFNDDPIEELSPMISNSGNLMMSAMNGSFSGNGNQAFGPPEAFFPFTNIDTNGNVVQDSLESYDEEDTLDDDWALDDILDFGSTASAAGDDEAEEDSLFASSTPARPNTSTSEDHMNPLLANPHLVGAFRNNQDRHQLLSRNKTSRASLAFSGPLNQRPIRGIKDNRLAAANTPITPIRRQKPAKIVYPSSPASPLVQQSNKRKASNGEQISHKRSKSLV